MAADPATMQATQAPDKDERFQAVRELRDSVVLLALTVSSLGAYVSLGVLVVRILANGR